MKQLFSCKQRTRKKEREKERERFNKKKGNLETIQLNNRWRRENKTEKRNMMTKEEKSKNVKSKSNNIIPLKVFRVSEQ